MVGLSFLLLVFCFDFLDFLCVFLLGLLFSLLLLLFLFLLLFVFFLLAKETKDAGSLAGLRSLLLRVLLGLLLGFLSLLGSLS